MAYNRLQALPLPVGGHERCVRAMLGGTPVEELLTPAGWDASKCFNFALMQRQTLEMAASCRRDCHVCTVRNTSHVTLSASAVAASAIDSPSSRPASARLSYFDCAGGSQPQYWLRPPPQPRRGERQADAHRASTTHSQSTSECASLPTELQSHLRLPSLSPLDPEQPYSPRRGRSSNWCRNVSLGVWSSEGRRRYPTWPHWSGAPLLSGAALRSHSDIVLFDFDALAVPSPYRAAPPNAAERPAVTEAAATSATASATGGSPPPTAAVRPLIVYVRAGDAVGRFFAEVHRRLPAPYVLVSGGTDACAPPRNLEQHLDSPKLLAWFARNPSTVHPKLQPLPTGCDVSNVSLWMRALALAPAVARDKLLYASFSMRPGAAQHDRKAALEAAQRIGATAGAHWHVATPGRAETRLSELEDAYNMARSRFVVSPVGNGFDCTRTYRALLVGAIPILNRRTNHLVDSGLFSGTPVLVVDDWRQLTPAFLARRHAELVSRFRRGWERRWLFAESWVERIRQTAAAGRLPTGACGR